MRLDNTNGRDRCQANRRRILRSIGTVSVGLSGIGFTTVKADDDKNIIVHTRDTDGEPDKVREVPEERYKRIKSFLELTKDEVPASSEVVAGLKLKQPSSDETDLVLHIILSENEIAETEDFEVPRIDRLQGIPVKFVEAEIREPEYKSCREGQYYTSMRGNMEIGVEGGNPGTASFVAEDANTSDPCILTAAHVVEERNNDDLYQPAPGSDNSRIIGEFIEASQQRNMDIAKYSLDHPQYSKYATAEFDQEDITGSWDFERIVDRTTSGNPIPCTFAGSRVCSADVFAEEATRDMSLDYQVNYDDQVAVGGDSGGPFVGWDGKLVGTLTGEMGWGGNIYDFGPSGTELLQYVAALPPL